MKNFGFFTTIITEDYLQLVFLYKKQPVVIEHFYTYMMSKLVAIIKKLLLHRLRVLMGANSQFMNQFTIHLN